MNGNCLKLLAVCFSLFALSLHVQAEEVEERNLPARDFAAEAHLPSGGHSFVVTGSSVNTVTRDYTRDKEDIAVTVPGGKLSVHRYYENDAWHWSHNRDNLSFEYDGAGKMIEIVKSGVVFKASYSDGNIYTYDVQSIVRNDEGFKWLNPSDKWIQYDPKGRFLAKGKRGRTIAKAIYENDKCVGWADATGSQVFWFEYTGDNLTAVTDRADRKVEYGYDGNLLSSVTDLRGYTTNFKYSNKLLSRVEEPGGKVRNIAYGPYGDVVSVTDDAGVGHFFEFDYDKGAKEYYAFIRFPSGKAKEVWYDYNGKTKRVDINGTTVQSIKVDGRTQWVTDARNLVTKQVLDEWDNIVETVYPDDTWEKKVYKQPGNLLVQVNRMGIITNYEYDDSGDRKAMIEAVGTEVERRTEYSYTSEGAIKTRTIKGVDGDSTTTYEYDLSGHLISITDPENRVTKFFDFDLAGNAKTIEDGRGYKRYLEYDEAGNIRVVRDHNNKLIAEYRYDAAGNRSTQIDAFGKAYSFVYDADNNLLSVTDPLESTMSREYNLADKVTSTVDQEGNAVYHEYDLYDRLAKTIDGEGNVITYQYATADGCSSCSGGSDMVSKIIYPTFSRELIYDERGRLVEQHDGYGGVDLMTTYVYDGHGNRVSVTDPEGKATLYSYDALGRVISEITADGAVTEYRYDNKDNLVQLTDANGGITLFSYDKSDKLISEVRPLKQSISYTYDKAGNLHSQIDSNDRRTVFSYDVNNRLVKSEVFAKSTDTVPVKTVSYGYNDAGSLISYDDGTTSASYQFDDLQRKVAETVNYPGFALTHAYSYYKNSRKKSYTDPAGRERFYSYDKALRPVGVDFGVVGQVAIGGYDWNRPTKINLPGGSSLNYTYDGLQQMLSVKGLDPGGNAIINYSYNYSGSGNIKKRTTEHGGYDYGYNEVYRLISAQMPKTTESFEYDKLGNRTASKNINDFEYNLNNQLASGGGVDYGYDQQGNLTSKTEDGITQNFVYSVENRLEKIQDAGGTTKAGYAYDPYGRRLWKEVSGKRTYFHYNDEGLVGEYNDSGKEIKTYGYQPGSPWSTNPLFMQEGGIYYWYMNDHLGTPQKIVAENGKVVWSAKYGSFGKAVVEVEAVESNLRFPGQYFDEEIGLHYNWHRFYDPETGRYNRFDPVGLNGGVNYYLYGRANPILEIDSNGLFCQTIFSITIPHLKELAGSTLVNKSDWIGLAASPEISMSPPVGWFKKPRPPIKTKPGPGLPASGYSTGIAHCSALRRLIYEDTYKRFGTKIEVGYCVSRCEGSYFWNRATTVLLDSWKENRTEKESLYTQIKIQAATGQLAALACQNWVNNLNK